MLKVLFFDLFFELSLQLLHRRRAFLFAALQAFAGPFAQTLGLIIQRLLEEFDAQIFLAEDIGAFSNGGIRQVRGLVQEGQARLLLDSLLLLVEQVQGTAGDMIAAVAANGVRFEQFFEQLERIAT